MRHQLNAVANSQDRDSDLENLGIRVRSSGFINRRRAAREDDRPRIPASYGFGAGVEREDLGVDTKLANSPGDKLGVLAAEIENDDEFVIRAHDIDRGL